MVDDEINHTHLSARTSSESDSSSNNFDSLTPPNRAKEMYANVARTRLRP